MNTETDLPELVGTLANLTPHTQATIRAYGAACARTALQSPEVQRLREDAVTDIEAAAKALAKCMDYPWEHMPEHGRENMRKNALDIIRAAMEKRP